MGSSSGRRRLPTALPSSTASMDDILRSGAGRRGEMVEKATPVLTVDDLRTLDGVGSVASVDDQTRMVHDPGVVVAGVVGNDDHRVVLLQVFERRVRHAQIVFAAAPDIFEVGVVVAH